MQKEQYFLPSEMFLVVLLTRHLISWAASLRHGVKWKIKISRVIKTQEDIYFVSPHLSFE